MIELWLDHRVIGNSSGFPVFTFYKIEGGPNQMGSCLDYQKFFFFFLIFAGV